MTDLRETIEMHRDDLEDLAASDLNCAWIADAILEAADEGAFGDD